MRLRDKQKKNYLIPILLVLILASGLLFERAANGMKYNHDSKPISEIKKNVDFKVFTPMKVPKEWTLDTKTTTFPIMLHYFNNTDTQLMVAIHQKAEPFTDPVSPNAESVDINGVTGSFQEWSNHNGSRKGDTMTGGLLRWVQQGTYIEMHSSKLTKQKMVELARSMKE